MSVAGLLEQEEDPNAIKFPLVQVQLSGKDGNAFFIIGRVKMALRAGGATDAQQDAFVREAMGGDYDNVLQTAMRWVDVR